MRVHIANDLLGIGLSAAPDYHLFARNDRHRDHVIVDTPDEADAIVFPDCHLTTSTRLVPELRKSEIFRNFRDKFYVINERDRPWCELPGLYTSMPRRALRPPYQVPCSYHMIESPRHRLGLPERHDIEPDLLFSLVASPTHPCREPLLRLEHPRAVVEQVEGFMFWKPSSKDFEARRFRFATLMLRSKFVLCPRGHGTSSIRYYETLAAGRVPVVIADDWVQPFGIDVSEFTIFWPEARTSGLIEMLESREAEAADLGRRAREAYDTYFAPDVRFHHIAEAVNTLAMQRPWESFRRFGYPDKYLVRQQVKGGFTSATSAISGSLANLRNRLR